MKSHEFRTTLSFHFWLNCSFKWCRIFQRNFTTVFSLLCSLELDSVQQDHTLTGIPQKPRRGRSNKKADAPSDSSSCLESLHLSQIITHTYPHTNSSQAPAGPVHQVEQEEAGHRDEISICEKTEQLWHDCSQWQRIRIGTWIYWHANTLTPTVPLFNNRGLDINSDSWEDTNGDGENKAHGKSHHPDLRQESKQ